MILPRPDAPAGSVAQLSTYDSRDFHSEDAVLCRNTAPLIGFAFELLARGIACHVVGKEIEIGLLQLIQKIGGDTIHDFRLKLREHSERETTKLIRKGKKEAAANYEDKCTAILIIARTCHGTEDLRNAIQKLFASGSGVTLSTIHKAKGLEWETVFLLDWNLLPSRYAESDAAKTQEKNLQYVAVTRAKLDLRFIESGNWR